MRLRRSCNTISGVSFGGVAQYDSVVTSAAATRIARTVADVTWPAPDVQSPVRRFTRLAAVAATGLLDTPAEPAFDRLAELAARLLDAPFAFVTVVDETRSF